MRPIAPVLILAALLPGCSSLRQEPPGQPAPPPAGSQVFTFANDPWVNLHHFLYQWARAEAPAPGPGRRGPRPVEVAERSRMAELSPELSQRDLLFDEGMVDLRSRIVQISAHPESLSSLPHAEVYEPAMAVYRRHWWPAHEAANRAWIDKVRPKLETFGPALARRLEEAYGGRFPTGAVRVDVCAYSNWAGAYTTATPPQIVISSLDPDLQDSYSLESLFHEVSHTDGLEGPLHDALERGFTKRGGKPPEDLWHYVIFYTAGELTREALRSQGLPEIVPYPERTGMYRRLPAWNRYRDVLDHSWKDFLAGRIDRETAVDRIAQELLAP